MTKNGNGETLETLGIFDPITTSHDCDILRAALIETCANSHIPELYLIFGRENFLKFLDIFAGTTLTVPSREQLNGVLRNVAIFLALERAPDGTKENLISDLAVHYGITRGLVIKAFIEMEERLKRYRVHA